MADPVRAETMLAALRGQAASRPDGEAFTFDERLTTYGELWSAIERAAQNLAVAGIERGEPVLLALPNGPELFTAFYGVQRAGGVAVPLYPGSGAERLVAYAQRAGARRAIVEPTVEEAVAGAAPELAVWAPGQLSTEASAPLPEVGPQELCYLQYTSGSTGEPKGVEIRHHMAVENVHQMIAGMAITPDDVFVSWLPVHHDMGLVLMTMVPFVLGARLVLLPATLADVRAWPAAIDRHRGTFTAAPDFAYRLLLRTVRDPGRYDLSSLRVALNAAEPVRADTVRAFEHAFGLRQVMRPAYGLAEATVGVSMVPADGRPVRVDERGHVSVGRPFPGVEVAILGADGALAGIGEEGEILVRSPAVTSGYWRDPEATEQLFVDGYLATGDLGTLDDDGELTVVGRKKQLIIQGGRNIAPREVEEILDALPFSRRSAAVGVDRGRAEGEQIYAFVELRSRRTLSEEAYAGHCAEAVEAIQGSIGVRPGRVYLVPPRTLPMTANGKLRYSELRQLYQSGELQRQGLLLFPAY